MTHIKIHCQYTKLVPLSELKQHPKNRNKHDKNQIDRLAKILQYQGIRYPIKVSNQTGFITSGHGRLMAAKKLGMKDFPVSFQDYDSEDQEYADVQSDNAIASWAELDLSSINLDIQELGPDFDIDLLGIKGFEIDVADKNENDPDALPEHVEPKTKPGDIYLLGDHKLLCGDATSISDIQKLMGEEQVDMVWTDPPYNLAYEGKTKEALTIQNDKMDNDLFFKFLYDAFTNMLMFTKAGCAIYVAHSDTEGHNFRKAMIDSGWLFKQCLMWVKQTLVMGRQDYHWKHEPILYGWAPGASHNWYTDRKQTTVLEFDKPSKSIEHPTMKPVELIEYCLNNSCPPKGTVLDIFGGSGSTLISCEKTGRKARLVELDPKYCDVIVARWEEYCGKKATLFSDSTVNHVKS